MTAFCDNAMKIICRKIPTIKMKKKLGQVNKLNGTVIMARR